MCTRYALVVLAVWTASHSSSGLYSSCSLYNIVSFLYVGTSRPRLDDQNQNLLLFVMYESYFSHVFFSHVFATFFNLQLF